MSNAIIASSRISNVALSYSVDNGAGLYIVDFRAEAYHARAKIAAVR